MRAGARMVKPRFELASASPLATLTGLSLLLKAGLHDRGLRLGIALTRGWSNPSYRVFRIA